MTPMIDQPTRARNGPQEARANLAAHSPPRVPLDATWWTSDPYAWTYGQVWRLDHMPTLRRTLDHRSTAYGLTRFACRTAFLFFQPGIPGRGLVPHDCQREGGRELGDSYPYPLTKYGATIPGDLPSVGQSVTLGPIRRQERTGAALWA